ncbi:HAD hydrolase family protein [Streptomyces lavendulae]
MPTRPIRLLLADVDGTLVTSNKVLTDRAVRAVHKLYYAGVQFAVTSGRPPLGMSMIIEPLALATELAAFNGGRLAAPRTGRRRRPTVGDGGGEVGAVSLLESERGAAWSLHRDWISGMCRA